MSNEFYNASNAPATGSALSSATIRAEFAAVEDALDKLPTMSGNANKVLKVNSGASGLTSSTITDDGTNVSIFGDLTVGGNVTLGDASTDTLNVGNGGIIKDASGRVGIGRTPVQQSLEVNGGVFAKNGAPGANGVNNTGYSFGSGGDTDSGLYSSSDGSISVYNNSVQSVDFTLGTIDVHKSSPTEGGQIVLHRGSDDTADWNIDCLGGDTGSTSSRFRIFDRNGVQVINAYAGHVATGGNNAQADVNLNVGGTITGTNGYGIIASATGSSGLTGNLICVNTSPIVPDVAQTTANVIGYHASGLAKGASATVSEQIGFYASSSLTAGTLNYGFYSAIGAGTGRWNFYAAGDAPNYFAGSVGIGIAPYETGIQVGFTKTGYVYNDLTNGGTTATDGAIFRAITKDVAGTGATSLDIVKRKDGRAAIRNGETNAAAYIGFEIGASERMRIDSAGAVGIGVDPTGLGAKFVVDGAINGRAVGSEGGELSLNTPDNASVGLYVDVVNSTVGRIYQTQNNSDLRIGQSSGTGGIVSLYTSSAERLKIDSSGNVRVTSAGGGLGYGTGAGGTVTQATSKSTAVTLNKPTGQITMNNAALAAGASVSFVLNNTILSGADAIIVNQAWDSIPASNYRVEVQSSGIAAAEIRLTNISAGSLSQAVALNFVIIKGATA